VFLAVQTYGEARNVDHLFADTRKQNNSELLVLLTLKQFLISKTKIGLTKEIVENFSNSSDTYWITFNMGEYVICALNIARSADVTLD
jgi:hypothetical protein